uniref:Secreted protein n=1 Tax=Macrostomum lignano TaxID=282301 RepID=A0A1I8J2T5_9PLAT
MYLAAPIFLVFVTVFQFVVGSLGPATLPPLRMLPKLSPGPGGGATSGLAPPPQPPPRPPDASTSDDEDLAVAKAGGASGDRPWPLGPLGGASSGDAWPPAPHQPNATVGGPWPQRPTVRIELPVARTSTAKPWQPWQPRPTPANNGG